MFMNEMSALKFCACTYTVSSKTRWEHLSGRVQYHLRCWDAPPTQPQLAASGALRGPVWPYMMTVQLSSYLVSPWPQTHCSPSSSWLPLPNPEGNAISGETSEAPTLLRLIWPVAILTGPKANTAGPWGRFGHNYHL